jgi:hypothetical protein
LLKPLLLIKVHCPSSPFLFLVLTFDHLFCDVGRLLPLHRTRVDGMGNNEMDTVTTTTTTGVATKASGVGGHGRHFLRRPHAVR